MCQLTQTALKGFLAQKFKNENDCCDTTELDQDIETGQKAANTVCQYVDWLLSTVNPNPPDEDMWIRPVVHPCQRRHSDIQEHDKQSDYVDLLNMVQRHTHCSTSYCLRKKSNETELKCRFHFPFHPCPKTRLEFEEIPWKTTQNNAWGDQEPTDEVLINCWHEFLQTSYGQSNIPDWFDKLQAVIQSQEPEDEPSKEQETTQEEWMILSDLHTPFDNSEQTRDSTYDWHLDRANYSEQQIQEMPTWIKKNKEEYTIDE